MGRGQNDGDYPAGGEPADSSRTKRVEEAGSLISGVYQIGRWLDEGEFDAAADGVVLLTEKAEEFKKAVLSEVKALRKGQRSREALHGQAASNAQVAFGTRGVKKIDENE